MQSYHSIDSQSADMNGIIHQASTIPSSNYTHPEDATQLVSEPTKFYSQFIDSMEMYADRETVSRYFDVHHEWFRRCAHPMQAEAIDKNSYALLIGQYGSFGFEVEPKIGLDLLPQENGVYRIETVPVPGYAPVGYDVDFRAAMELIEIAGETLQSHPPHPGSCPTKITRVQWQLDLTVFIQFPRFIHALPKSLIQSTGDRVLQQVVRQVSGRLTRKVLEDFHTTHNLPIPKKSKRWFFQKHEEV
ncbi:MAG: DUF1997 domain-containing protein [Leptolyngbyaceae cyanobacterium bins.302]|nr:DUF1997 domain-containing protein [Leptolyngbyaceae cyanobacterium bins.302]